MFDLLYEHTFSAFYPQLENLSTSLTRPISDESGTRMILTRLPLSTIDISLLG